MTALAIPARSNPAEYKLLGSPKVVNAYAEQGGEDNKAPYTIVPCAGLKTFSTLEGLACRGMIYVESEQSIYVVRGSQVHKIVEDGTATFLGYIGNVENVSIARNNAEEQDIVIVADGKAALIKNDTLTQIDYPFVPKGVTYLGGYFIYWLEDGKFYATELTSTATDALRFVTAEGHPDGLTACLGVVDHLYAIGPDSTELWSLNGGADFPLSRVGGAYMQIGSNSPRTVKPFDNGAMWVGSDNVVYYVSGYTFTAVSSKEVARLIEDEADKTTIVAFTYSRGVNKFYCLQGTGWTREFNAATGEWHNREDRYGVQWHALHYVNAWGKDIVGDRLTGQLFELDYDIYTDNGSELAWGFDTQIFHSAPNGLSFEKLYLDMETGDGIGVDDEAFVILSWSDDNGRTWKGVRHLSLGRKGQYLKRVTTSRLGSCGEKGRMFRVRITDPAVRAIAAIDADVSPVPL